MFYGKNTRNSIYLDQLKVRKSLISRFTGEQNFFFTHKLCKQIPTIWDVMRERFEIAISVSLKGYRICSGHIIVTGFFFDREQTLPMFGTLYLAFQGRLSTCLSR